MLWQASSVFGWWRRIGNILQFFVESAMSQCSKDSTENKKESGNYHSSHDVSCHLTIGNRILAVGFMIVIVVVLMVVIVIVVIIMFCRT